MCETKKDIHNIEAWAQVIEEILDCAPWQKRAAILELALQQERAERKKNEEAGGGLRFIAFGEDEWRNSPGMRHWHAIKRLKSLLVQVLVRSITNDHSPEAASKLLFAHHRYGTGSGDLDDYLDGRLPPRLRQQ